jgi:hypothetical protein
MIVCISSGDGTWNHVMPHLGNSVLKSKTLEQLTAYGSLVLDHLLNPKTVNGMYPPC